MLHGRTPGVFEAIQPRLGRLEFLLQLGEPGWVREITRTHNANTLERRPFVEIFRIQLAARGPGIPRMDVEVSDKLHRRDLLSKRVPKHGLHYVTQLYHR